MRAATLIVALIVIETKRGVCIDGIEAVFLQSIGAHLVGEAKAAAFLRQVENNAAAKIVQPRHREPKLVTAITASRTEDVGRQACRMQPHGHRFGEVRLAHDDGNLNPAHSVAEYDEARTYARIERHRSFARQRQRLSGVVRKPSDRVRLDRYDFRLVCENVLAEIGRQHRRQALRQFHELDRCRGRVTRRCCLSCAVARCVGNGCQDGIGGIVCRKTYRHRRFRVNAERMCAP